MLRPASPDILDFRINHLLHAFETTGLDFAGPLYIRNETSEDRLKVHFTTYLCV